MAKATAKKRKVIVESTGEAHISATFNNIIISLTNKKGEVISWSSAGKMGFRGSKKNTPYAAQMAAEDCSKVALEAGLKKVKTHTVEYHDLDHLFGIWSEEEYKAIQKKIDSERKIDKELWE